MVYILNAKYLFGNGIYFEWFRPPFPSVLLAMFGIVKTRLAEYLFIIFVSGLHFFSSLKLAKKFGISKYYYLISISPFLLLYGMNVGTELLTLSLIQLFFAYYNKIGSSSFLALAFLTRYPAIMFTPLILFKKNLKKIVLDIFIFLLVISPWLIYNYLHTGNFIYSILDSYALNIKFRDYFQFNLGLTNLLIVGNYLIIFFIIGFYKKLKTFNKYDLIMIISLILILTSYIKTPYKEPRYLFLALIPFTYFSTVYISKLKHSKEIINLLLVLNLVILIITFSFYNSTFYNNKVDDFNLYKSALPSLDNCTLMSNAWVHLNYLGVVTEQYPREELIDYHLKKGNRILLFYDNSEPSYIQNADLQTRFKVINKTNNFILLGDKEKCNPKEEKYVYDYLSNIKQYIQITRNITIDTSTKQVLFGKY